MVSLLDRTAATIIRIVSNGKKDSADSLNSEVNLKGLFCENPFTQFDIYEDSKAYTCCSAWLPKSIGKVSANDIFEIWNSEDSQKIRKSILDGTYRYCDKKICPKIQSNRLLTVEEAKKNDFYKKIIEERVLVLEDLPQFINLCNDASCNLYCPSCRKEQTLHTKGREYAKRQHLQDLIEKHFFSRPSQRHFRVNITGSGDPFASRVFRNFLFTLDGNDFPNLTIHLQTNGVLLTPNNWNKMHKIHKNISIILISFDAATEETYKITRPGGNWPILLKNTKRLGEIRKFGKLNFLRLDYVVQEANFKEIPDFVALAKNLGVDQVSFSMVLDWGTWSKNEYRNKCIWKSSHPRFNEFLDVLRHPILGDEIVNLGNITAYRNAALTPG